MENEDFYANPTNRITIIAPDGKEVINPHEIKGLSLRASGNNNVIRLHEPFNFKQNLLIAVTGDITIEIQENSLFSENCIIKKSRNTAHNALSIGKGFSCGPRCTIDLTDAGDVFIGNDAKWSWNIYVKSDDTHPIFDAVSGRCLNKSKKIKIGNHVWIGMNAVILKNTVIRDNSIVGAYAVVAGKFKTGNCTIAGNPARIRRTGLNWTHGSIASYCRNHKTMRVRNAYFHKITEVLKKLIKK